MSQEIGIGHHQAADVPNSPFASILNFRDIGATINQLSHSSPLRPGLICRSARPDGASADDLRTLQSQYQIKTIIDLRSNTEKVQQAKRPGGQCALEEPSWNRVEVDLNGGPFARALMRRLSWSSLCKMMFLYAGGWRLDAIRILCSEVMEPRGLTGLAHDSLDHSKANIRAVFELLGDRSNYPVLIHCTQGKDRTGVVVILLLLLLEVPEALIDQDYRASPAELIKEEQERLKEIHSMGLGSTFAECPEGFVDSVRAYIDDHYGDVEAYLKACNVSGNTLDNIKSIMKP